MHPSLKLILLSILATSSLIITLTGTSNTFAEDDPYPFEGKFPKIRKVEVGKLGKI